MTDLKLIMRWYNVPRYKARRKINRLRKNPSPFYEEYIKLIRRAYHLVYIGDKPGEGTNIGCGLVNCVEEVECAD